MKRVTSSSYLRYPHLNGELLTFVAENDVWLAPITGGRAWRLTSDNVKALNPRFSPDGSKVAWTSWRDGDPEVYVADADGTSATRLTYWGDDRTLVLGWTSENEVIAISAVGQPDTHFTWAYAIPLDGAPGRLPYGPVTDLAVADGNTALLSGRFNREPAWWKRYRGGTAGRLWTATAADPLFTRVHAELPGQFGGVMLIDGRLVFGADHEGTGNIYSSALDGSDLRRHTDNDGFYTRHPSSDGRRVVYSSAGDIWLLDDLSGAARQVEITLGSPAPARAPRMVTAADHLGGLSVDPAGQASAIEVRGTVHWLTHKDGPARALHVDGAVRARLPRVLGDSAKAVFATDGELRVSDGQVIPLPGAVIGLAAAPDGAMVAAATQDGKLYLAEVASGTVTELASGDDGQFSGLAWSPDSAWLAWSEPSRQRMRRIRMARVADRRVVEVTDGRFMDTEPVFTLDGEHLAFLSRRSFDPVYDAQLFDMSFPFGSRPYLVPLGALTPSPFAPLAAGRPMSAEPDKREESELAAIHVDEDGLADRVVTVPVPEARYGRLRAVKGGLAWLREPLHGVLGESGADLDDDAPRSSLEQFDFAKREVTEVAAEADWFEVSGDGTRLVVKDKDELRVLPSSAKAEGPDQAVTVDLSRARFLADPVAQWRHAFDEAGRVMRRGFWVADMSGVDWDGVLDQYRPLLDKIRVKDDFIDLMWEVFGELGTSHAYVYPGGGSGGSVGQLGADLSVSESGEWIVDRVLRGESSDPRARSPLAAPGAGVRPGDAILAVDGQPIDPLRGPWPLLDGTAGKPVELTVRSDSGTRAVVVVPTRSQRRLRYQDWVASRRALTRELSEGRLGYLHIPNMVGEGWAHFSRDLRTEMRFEGVIMDVRGNSGGHISELVVSKLTPRVYGWDTARWEHAHRYPNDARRGPVITLADEMAGSDGDIVTAAIRSLGLGPVVGARTWGGVIGYDEPYELIEGTRMTIPGYSFAFDEYGWGVENYGVDPDVEVYITPDDWAADRDPQLETAVRLALEALDKHPAATAPDPATAPHKARPPLPPRP
jgi:tricorn protease